MTEITQIKKLKNLGIFRQFAWHGLKDFNKLNLIYGWNGSGKSTLSAVFEAMELKTALTLTHYAQPEYQIATASGTIFDGNNIDQCNLSISTFNRGFIARHIDWDKQLEGILLVDQQKIADVQKLKDQKILAVSQNQEASTAKKKYVATEQARKDFLTQAAKRIKTSLQVIATTDTRYLNYDRTKLFQLIEEHAQGLLAGEFVQVDQKVIELTKEASPASKPKLPSIAATSISKERYQKAFERLSELLGTSAENTAIERLKNHPDLQEWVAIGLNLHSSHKSENCEFCGELLKSNRLDTLGKHFNTSYVEFQDRLQKATTWLNEQKLQLPELPNDDQLYDELHAAYQQAKSKLIESIHGLNMQLESWAKVLSQKVDNQSLILLAVEKISESSFDLWKQCTDEVAEILMRHDEKTANFSIITKRAKDALELHYASLELADFKYFSKLQEEKEAVTQLQKLNEQLGKTNEEISSLEKSVSTSGLGANEFNLQLHRFLGHSEISLNIAPNGIGYVISRGDATNHVVGLSEGEKTAVALVYFMTKLKENGRAVTDQIVILDG